MKYAFGIMSENKLVDLSFEFAFAAFLTKQNRVCVGLRRGEAADENRAYSVLQKKTVLSAAAFGILAAGIAYILPVNGR